MAKSVLVTGATGSIGTQLVMYLAGKGDVNVCAFVRDERKAKPLVKSGPEVSFHMSQRSLYNSVTCWRFCSPDSVSRHQCRRGSDQLARAPFAALGHNPHTRGRFDPIWR